MRRVSVARKSNVSVEEITQEHLQGCGKPVIITDAIDRWPARSKWTFAYFKDRYGSDLASAWLSVGSRTGKLTKLGAYIDFLDGQMQDLPGIWIGKDGLPLKATPQPSVSPLYLLGWNAFEKHPELFQDITPAPYFVQDLLLALSSTLRDILDRASGQLHTAIYLGPPGSLSPLHRDYWKTHAYLAQIRGRKRAILFSPEDTEFIYQGQVDPEQPDVDRFPLFERATAYECVMGPGDTLLIPSNWWHHVRGLEKSITVSHNFFNDTNLTAYMNVALRKLPASVEGVGQAPDWRKELELLLPPRG